MKGLGTFALIVGVCWLIFALSMDVSVPSGAGGRVSNLGLMADRQVHTIVGGMIAIAGLLMVLLGGRSSPLHEQMRADSRPCPLCAEAIKGAAIKCKHCGA
ncbi:zinc ribbon domain-containing protein, partial [Pseudomonas rustica]|uniref:zinc ribbon domain-containing protein n=1 Tax=Pseudomonas rustica TaxID=2827099 RepID=UPI001BAFFC6A